MSEYRINDRSHDSPRIIAMVVIVFGILSLILSGGAIANIISGLIRIGMGACLYAGVLKSNLKLVLAYLIMAGIQIVLGLISLILVVVGVVAVLGSNGQAPEGAVPILIVSLVLGIAIWREYNTELFFYAVLLQSESEIARKRISFTHSQTLACSMAKSIPP